MNIGGLIAILIVAATKFLFSPSLSIYNGYTVWETILIVTIGGVIGVSIFFFGAKTLVEFSNTRKRKKEEQLKAKGIVKTKKVFTPFRRRIIRIKRSFGLTGIAIVTPCIISIPIGSIIAARFYHHKPQTVYVLYLSVFAWAVILTYFNDIVVSIFQ